MMTSPVQNPRIIPITPEVLENKFVLPKDNPDGNTAYYTNQSLNEGLPAALTLLPLKEKQPVTYSIEYNNHPNKLTIELTEPHTYKFQFPNILKPEEAPQTLIFKDNGDGKYGEGDIVTFSDVSDEDTNENIEKAKETASNLKNIVGEVTYAEKEKAFNKRKTPEAVEKSLQAVLDADPTLKDKFDKNALKTLVRSDLIEKGFVPERIGALPDGKGGQVLAILHYNHDKKKAHWSVLEKNAKKALEADIAGKDIDTTRTRAGKAIIQLPALGPIPACSIDTSNGRLAGEEYSSSAYDYGRTAPRLRGVTPIQ